MQKTIRIFAILSAALAGFSLILLIASLPFQQLYAQLLNYPEYLMGALPVFPVVPFLSCLLKVGCFALLIICCGKKGGIGLEILMIIVFIAVLPLISTVATFIHTGITSSLGSNQLMANSLMSTISTFCCSPANWGQALAYITCGMSIAFKTINKQYNSKQ